MSAREVPILAVLKRSHKEADRLLNRCTTHPVQADVEEFHRALDIPTHDTPGIRRPELRAELIREALTLDQRNP